MFHHISHNPNDEEVQEYMKQKTLHLIGLAVLNIPSNILFRWFFARYSLKLLPIDPAGEHNSITIEDLGTGEVRRYVPDPYVKLVKGVTLWSTSVYTALGGLILPLPRSNGYCPGNLIINREAL